MWRKFIRRLAAVLVSSQGMVDLVCDELDIEGLDEGSERLIVELVLTAAAVALDPERKGKG